MNIDEKIEVMKNIQDNILNYIDNEEDNEENYQNLRIILDNQKILNNKYDIISILHIILNISNYHQRSANFFAKIFKILDFFRDIYQKHFSSMQIFNFFSSNKRILLYLLEEKILIMDQEIAKQIKKSNNRNYFQPEIEKLLEKDGESTKLPENFYENRKIGENEDELCELIRKDLIKEFLVFVNKKELNLESKLKSSIYETNSFLIKNESITLIEYAAFYGSIQIFQYLQKNGIKLKPSLWNFAVHGCNGEIIHILEENKIEPPNKKYQNCLIKSIEFHHNDMANYILNNFFENQDEISNVLLKHGLKYHNFAFIDSKLIGKSCFSFLCEFDYPDLIDILIEKVDIDVNHKETIKEEIEVIEKEEEEEEEQNEININECNEITPLSMAIENNNVEVFKILFANEKLDVNLKSKYSRSSCLRNHDEFFVGDDDSNDDDDNGDIKYNHINESEKTALFIAIEKNNEEILKLLLSNKNIDVNIRNKFINKSESKLSDGETLEIKEKTALYFAVEKGNSNIVELLLQNENIDVNIPYIYKKERNNNKKLNEKKANFQNGKSNCGSWRSYKYNYREMKI